jgi:hypothetical protein
MACGPVAFEPAHRPEPGLRRLRGSGCSWPPAAGSGGGVPRSCHPQALRHRFAVVTLEQQQRDHIEPFPFSRWPPVFYGRCPFTVAFPDLAAGSFSPVKRGGTPGDHSSRIVELARVASCATLTLGLAAGAAAGSGAAQAQAQAILPPLTQTGAVSWGENQIGQLGSGTTATAPACCGAGPAGAAWNPAGRTTGPPTGAAMGIPVPARPIPPGPGICMSARTASCRTCSPSTSS